MSDLGYKSEEELLDTLRYCTKTIGNLEIEIETIEKQLKSLKTQLRELTETKRRIIHYFDTV